MGLSGPIFSSLLTWIGFQEAVSVSEVKPSTSHLGTSFIELSAEPVDSSESPEADPLKTDVLDQVRSSVKKVCEIL